MHARAFKCDIQSTSIDSEGGPAYYHLCNFQRTCDTWHLKISDLCAANRRDATDGRTYASNVSPSCAFSSTVTTSVAVVA